MQPAAAAASVNESTRQPDLGELHKRLSRSCNLDELQTLALRLAVPWEELPGEILSAKARELILYLERRGRLGELDVAIATLHNSERVSRRSIRGELRRYVGLQDRLSTYRVLRAIHEDRFLPSDLQAALAIIQRAITAVQNQSAAFDDPVLPALCERISRITGHSNQDLHKLAVAVRIVPVLLRSPDILAIGRVDELEKLWKRLTGSWPPRIWVWIVLAVAAAVLSYGVVLRFFLQDRPFGDQFVTTTNEAERLRPEIWDYHDLAGWEVKDGHLEIRSPGAALLRTDRLREGRLNGFSLSFLVGIPSGGEAAWVLHARRLAGTESLQGYEFRVTVGGTSAYLNGYRLPGQEKLQGGGLLGVGEFNPATDLLNIEAIVRGATFEYTVRRTPLSNASERILNDPTLGRAFPVVIRDPARKYLGGAFGLLGGTPGGLVRLEALHVRPAWRWY